MTDYVQKKIAPGVELLAVPAGRFKTNELAIHLAVPMEEQMAANYALAISAVSRKGKAYPDMRALHLQLDKLYGAAISVTANKSGGCQILKMGITTLDDRFALDDEKIAEESIVATETDDETLIAGLANEAPIVRFVNLVLFQAVKDRASDIHFEPFETEFRIRYRVDGALYEMSPPPKHLALPVVSRMGTIRKPSASTLTPWPCTPLRAR